MLTSRAERLFLLTLALIQFGHILDFMIVMPLGPMLIEEFGIGAREFAFLVAAYSFSAATAGLLATTFVDRFERKGLLLIIFVLFALATVACGLAQNFTTLCIARGFAGAFGGLLGALVQTMIGDAIPFERRARAGSTVSAAFSVATVAGVPSSLWLANHFGWRLPFLAIGGLCLFMTLWAPRTLPVLRNHLGQMDHAHPLSALLSVLRDGNHRNALLFSALVIFSGFTVIPYITLYAVGNVGIEQKDIPMVYLVGGAATLVTARLIGHWADHSGKVRVYRIVAGCALLPLFAITHAGVLPLTAWLICTTGFFVMISGRMIPAMAIIASSAQPAMRGTFMSLNGTVQSLAMGLATTLAGFIIFTDTTGAVSGYRTVGYIAMAANLIAILFVGKILMHGKRLSTPVGATHE